MTWGFIILIFCVLLFFAIIKSKIESEEADSKQNREREIYDRYRNDIKDHHDKLEKYNQFQEEMSLKCPGINTSVFRANYAESYIHFKSLTPDEADLIMYQNKIKGKYVDNEIFIGLRDCMDKKKDGIWISALKNTNPENYKELIDKARSEYLSTSCWLKFQEVIAPHHEAFLLSEIEKTAPSKIEKWIRDKKKEGYFFSDLVYEKALEKRLSVKRKVKEN